MFKKFFITIMITSIMVLCPLIASADGVNYLGEICFEVSDGSFHGVDIEGRLGVLAYSDKHFALDGYIDTMGPYYGTAIIRSDGYVVISLTGTNASADFPQAGSFTYSSSIYMVVNPSTLQGDFRIMGFTWGNVGEQPIPFTAGWFVGFHACN